MDIVALFLKGRFTVYIYPFQGTFYNENVKILLRQIRELVFGKNVRGTFSSPPRKMFSLKLTINP